MTACIAALKIYKDVMWIVFSVDFVGATEKVDDDSHCKCNNMKIKWLGDTGETHHISRIKKHMYNIKSSCERLKNGEHRNCKM